MPALDFLRWDLSGRIEPGPPILASGRADSLAECLDAGCADYLREPWTLGELEARLARVALPARAPGPTPSHAEAWEGRGAGRLVLARIFDESRGLPLGKAYLAERLGLATERGRAVDMRVARLRAALRAIGCFGEAAALRCAKGSFRYEPGCGKLVTCLCRKG